MIRGPVTCQSLLASRAGATAESAGTTETVERARQGTLREFLRFVAVGGSSTAVYAVIFVGLASQGYLPAHVLATVVSSMLANELHRRLTFRAGERVGWLSAQVEAGGVSLFGLVVSGVALAWLDATVGSAQPMLQIGLVVVVTATIGLIRFLALRWIFRPSERAAAQ